MEGLGDVGKAADERVVVDGGAVAGILKVASEDEGISCCHAEAEGKAHDGIVFENAFEDIFCQHDDDYIA